MARSRPRDQGDRPSQGEEGHTQASELGGARARGRAARQSPQQRAEALVATRRRHLARGPPLRPRGPRGDDRPRSKAAPAARLRDPNVSRRHAELRRAASGEDWTVADLGSTNGVKANGRRVASTRLSPGCNQATIRSDARPPVRHPAVTAGNPSMRDDPIPCAPSRLPRIVLDPFLLVDRRARRSRTCGCTGLPGTVRHRLPSAPPPSPGPPAAPDAWPIAERGGWARAGRGAST